MNTSQESNPTESVGFYIIQELPNPVVVYDSNNEIIFVNNAFECLTEYNRTEVIGTALPCLWWPVSHRQEMLEKYKEAIQRGEMLGRRLHFFSKSGGDIYVDEQFKKANSHFVSTWTDITQTVIEQRLIENKLKDAGELLDNLISNQAALNKQLA